MANPLTPSELADSLRELCLEFKDDLELMQTHLDDLTKMAAQIEALQAAQSNDPQRAGGKPEA